MNQRTDATPVEHPAVPAETPPTLPDVATVTVNQPVDGTVKRQRKTRSDKGRTRPKAPLVKDITVDPRVMTAAKEAMKPGQRLVIVDAETVRLVNS
jgi:hypothetical protein